MVMLLTMAIGASAQTDISVEKSLREDSVGLSSDLLPTDSFCGKDGFNHWQHLTLDTNSIRHPASTIPDGAVGR